MLDRRQLTETEQDTFEAPSLSGGYSPAEIRKSRRGIVITSLIFIAAFWYVTPGSGAVIMSVIVILIAALVWKLFASRSAIKLDENAPGMGKHVGPVTMGTILGYLYNGFRD